MGKSKYALTEERIRKLYDNGHGYGELEHYKPWVSVQTVSSRGRSNRVHSIKTNRIMQLLSDRERNYCYLLDFADNVLDIREQFPLDREATQEIALRLGYEHPRDIKTGVQWVMTTDFLITTIDPKGKPELLARTVKPAAELNNQRVQEKFDIEREYWRTKGVNWGIVTEKDISANFVKNIIWCHPYYRLDGYEGLEENVVSYIAEKLLSRLAKEPEQPISKILDRLDDEAKVRQGTCLAVLRHLLARKQIRMKDWYAPFSLGKTAAEFSISEVAGYVGNQPTYKMG